MLVTFSKWVFSPRHLMATIATEECFTPFYFAKMYWHPLPETTASPTTGPFRPSLSTTMTYKMELSAFGFCLKITISRSRKPHTQSRVPPAPPRAGKYRRGVQDTCNAGALCRSRCGRTTISTS